VQRGLRTSEMFYIVLVFLLLGRASKCTSASLRRFTTNRGIEVTGDYEADIVHMPTAERAKMTKDLFSWTNRVDVPGDNEHLKIQSFFKPCFNYNEAANADDESYHSNSVDPTMEKIIQSAVKKFSKFNWETGREWDRKKYRPCKNNSQNKTHTDLNTNLLKLVRENLAEEHTQFQPYVTLSRVRRSLKKFLSKRVAGMFFSEQQHMDSRKINDIEKLVSQALEKKKRNSLSRRHLKRKP
jgi:hypothetical protein